jgi:hypothetical protein
MAIGKLKDMLTKAPSPSAAIDAPAKLAKPRKPKSKIVSSLYLHPAAHRHVRNVAHSLQIKPHDIFLEALDEWLANRGHDSLEDAAAKALPPMGEE